MVLGLIYCQILTQRSTCIRKIISLTPSFVKVFVDQYGKTAKQHYFCYQSVRPLSIGVLLPLLTTQYNFLILHPALYQ